MESKKIKSCKIRVKRTKETEAGKNFIGIESKSGKVMEISGQVKEGTGRKEIVKRLN